MPGPGAEPWGGGQGRGPRRAGGVLGRLVPVPLPVHVPVPHPLPVDQMWGPPGQAWGQRGLVGRGHWDHPSPPERLPAPYAPPPPGVPHVPSPPMSLRGRSPPRGATPGVCVGGNGAVPAAVPSPPAACTPTPCQHSDCMSLPLTDGRTDGRPRTVAPRPPPPRHCIYTPGLCLV